MILKSRGKDEDKSEKYFKQQPFLFIYLSKILY